MDIVQALPQEYSSALAVYQCFNTSNYLYHAGMSVKHYLSVQRKVIIALNTTFIGNSPGVTTVSNTLLQNMLVCQHFMRRLRLYIYSSI